MGSEELVSALLRRIDERTAKVVVVGQGYVGLPLAMRAAEVGFPVVGYDTSAERIDALRAGTSYVEDITDDELAAALAAGYLPDPRPARPARLRRRDHHGADPAARRRARPLVHRGGAGATSPASSRRARSSCSSRRRTRVPPRSCCARSSRQSGLRGRHRLLPRLLARAHRPRQPARGRSSTRRRSSPASTPNSLAAVEAFYGSARRQGRARSRRRPRPSWSSCSRTRSGT